MKFWLFIIWLIVFIAIMTLSFNMLSAANTIENFAGLFIFIANVYFAVVTKCFTNININFKNNKK